MENECGSSLKDKSVAVIGLGSGGSVVADMLARSGVKRLTLVDPDKLEPGNLARHVLDDTWVGNRKVFAMANHLKKIREMMPVQIFAEKFRGLEDRPDVIASCVDSLACESLINAYSLEHNVPVVYGGVHGDAHTAEIITVVPGETPCYECYERTGELPPPSQEKYTNPNYDPTKMPHQEGLWCDILMSASLQVQAILGVLGVRERLSPLLLMSLRYPFKVERYNQKERCAVCSENFSGLSFNSESMFPDRESMVEWQKNNPKHRN